MSHVKWPCSISWRSFSRGFARKLTKYGTSFRVRTLCSTGYSMERTSWMGSFHTSIWHSANRWSLAFEDVSCVITFDLSFFDPYLSSRSSCHGFTIQIAKIWHIFWCVLCKLVCNIYCSGGILFKCYTKYITSIRGCVACNDFWPWSISFQVILPWFCSEYLEMLLIFSCVFCCSGSRILFIFGTVDLQHESVLQIRMWGLTMHGGTGIFKPSRHSRLV